MTRAAPSPSPRVQGIPVAESPSTTAPSVGLMPGTLTDVELPWIEGRLEAQLRFGRVAAERSVGPHKRIVSFKPGATFGLTRCTAADMGQMSWRLSIVTAAAAGSRWAAHPGIDPGGDILLDLDALEPIRAVLVEIDLIEASGIDLCDVAPVHWRHIAAQMAAALPFRSYGAERHAAWLRRRTVES
jgi:hypothetical protein